MKPQRFTFKKEARETGLSGVGNPYPCTIIKMNGKNVGSIVAPNWQTKDGKWRVRLMAVDGEIWRWICFAARFDDEPSAREWLSANAFVINSKYDLYEMDDT